MEKKVDQYDLEFLDMAYDDMMDFSGLDTQFINNILELAETNDEAYELTVRWVRSTNTGEKKYFEEQMAIVLVKNNLL